jgi:hypothetical protein
LADQQCSTGGARHDSHHTNRRRDRAAIVAPALLWSVAVALRRWNDGDLGALTDLRAEFESTLRDEFHDEARMARDETRVDDD